MNKDALFALTMDWMEKLKLLDRKDVHSVHHYKQVHVYSIYDLHYKKLLFSSRRRHTRFDCDWSSDVCSSDLVTPIVLPLRSMGVFISGATTKAPVSLLTKPATKTKSSPPAMAPRIDRKSVV